MNEFGVKDNSLMTGTKLETYTQHFLLFILGTTLKQQGEQDKKTNPIFKEITSKQIIKQMESVPKAVISVEKGEFAFS